MAKNLPFDSKVFLATIDGGRTVSSYPKNAIIFSQGDRADAVFYIQRGKVKIVVTSEQGKGFAQSLCPEDPLHVRRIVSEGPGKEQKCVSHLS